MNYLHANHPSSPPPSVEKFVTISKPIPLTLLDSKGSPVWHAEVLRVTDVST